MRQTAKTHVRGGTRWLSAAGVVALAWAFWMGPNALGDTLITKNGSQFEGTVTIEGGEYVLVKPSGGKMMFTKNMVDKVIFGPIAAQPAPAAASNPNPDASRPASAPAATDPNPDASRPASAPAAASKPKPASRPASGPAATTKPVDAAVIEIVNLGNLDLEIWIDDKPSALKRTLKPDESIQVHLRRGSHAMRAGTYVGGRVKPGTGALVGAAVVKDDERWIFGLAAQFDLTVWQRKAEALTTQPVGSASAPASKTATRPATKAASRPAEAVAPEKGGA